MVSRSQSQLPRTRVIPISDFFTRLQLEFLSYRFRSLIYQRAFDKKKFLDICVQKKCKISQIALENCLPTIFNNQEQQKKYLQKFFGETGLPVFCYRDLYQENVKGYWDCYYYFIVGSSVRLINNNEIEIGRIKNCDIKSKKLIITVDGKEVERNFCEVKRIFPSDFYQNLFK